MTTALVMIRDGRDELHAASLASMGAHLPLFDHYITIDDHDHSLGFGGAVREAWRRVLATDAEFIFHLELDFTFLRDVPLPRMIGALRANPHLAQVALVRQAVNNHEEELGGIIAVMDAAGSIVWRGAGDLFGEDGWIEHTHNFTTNPSVYPRWVAERGWPERSESEGHFSGQLLRDRPETRFAYWGQGEEWVTHIGTYRAGTGY